MTRWPFPSVVFCMFFLGGVGSLVVHGELVIVDVLGLCLVLHIFALLDAATPIATNLLHVHLSG